MILLESERKIASIHLSGPEGNAFYLLALAKKFSSTLNLDWEKVQTEMQSGDYPHLVLTFEKYFGNYVDLFAPPELYEQLQNSKKAKATTHGESKKLPTD